MINPNPNNDPEHNEQTPPPPVTAYCQNCGKPLDKESVRVVGSSVYCEPCLAARLGGKPAGAPRAASGAPGSTPFGSSAWGGNVWPPSGIAPSTPDPGLATLLGFIPGVGAMYNEQYAKGIVHLIVFAVLVSLVHATGIFLLFVFGWVFYMAIEARHTAQARRDGTPLPNPFGLNEIGERLGFGRAWPAASSYAPPPGTAPPPSAAGGPGSAGWTTNPAASAGPTQEVPGWGAPVDEYPYAPRPDQPSGYSPATSAQDYPSAYAQEYASNLEADIRRRAASGYGAAPDPGSIPPYGAPMPPYGSGPYTPPPYNATYVPPIPGDPAYVAPPNRFPAGAIWLIALGTIFLLATTGIFNVFPGGILVGFLLIGLGVWVFLRRMFDTGAGLASNGMPGYSLRVMRAARGAVWLVLTGLLLLLNDFHILRWYRSWPLFIIVAGVMALLERAVWSNASSAFVPPSAAAVPPATARSSMSIIPAHDPSDSSDQDPQHDPQKGGR